MPIFYPPPPPMMGASQPHAPRKLAPSIIAVPEDNPPFTLGGPRAMLLEIVLQQQPNPWSFGFAGRQPYEQRKLSPGIPGMSVDPPPTIHPAQRPIMAAIIAAAQPDPWTFNITARQPFEQRKLSPGIPGMSVDNPPFTLGGPYALKSEVVIFSQVDWSAKAWPYAFLGARGPYIQPKLAPTFLDVPVNNPPFMHRGRTVQMRTIIESWVPPPPHYEMSLYSSKHTPQVRFKPTAFGYVII